MDEAAQHADAGRDIHIVCPVQFETLHRASSWERYNVICRRIEGRYKDLICFLICDVPNEVHRDSLIGAISPLKRVCKYVLAEISVPAGVDFEALRVSGIDAVGMHLQSSSGIDERTMQKVKQIIGKAQRHSIPLVYMLGVPDTKVTTLLVCEGCDFIQGAAIHAPISKVEGIVPFKFGELFKKLVRRE